MAIKQEKRVGAPQPEVHETDYGAKFIKAATESEKEPDVPEMSSDETQEVAVPVADVQPEPDPQPVAIKEKALVPPKKKGRPKKQK
jgi:hypothetical protein